jgi:hypothetical protein
MTCTTCRHDQAKRREWGCDAATPEPIAWIDPCPFCGGRDDACTHCEGTNRVGVHRCPNALVSQRELHAITAAALVENGVMPDVGGWQDQAATFTQAWPLIMQEIEHWRGVHRRMAQQQAKK